MTGGGDEKIVEVKPIAGTRPRGASPDDDDRMEADLRLDHKEVAEHMMLVDMLSYLPDDIMVKVDRASMAVGLEARAPMLDHRVVEFAFSLPLSYKFRDGQTKWPLRQLLYRRVPRDLVERPKMGFGGPISQWLRGPLREWADDLLSPAALRSDGYLDSAAVTSAWQAHKSGLRDQGARLWRFLMFRAWQTRHAGPDPVLLSRVPAPRRVDQRREPTA